MLNFCSKMKCLNFWGRCPSLNQHLRTCLQNYIYVQWKCPSFEGTLSLSRAIKTDSFILSKVEILKFKKADLKLLCPNKWTNLMHLKNLFPLKPCWNLLKWSFSEFQQGVCWVGEGKKRLRWQCNVCRQREYCSDLMKTCFSKYSKMIQKHTKNSQSIWKTTKSFSNHTNRNSKKCSVLLQST